MSEEITNYEQSLWVIKINNQLLYRKYVDGVTTLKKSTPEESKMIRDILSKAIADASSKLSGRESKREAMAKRELDEISSSQPNQSTWTFKINSQLLFKKTIGGRTILFGMTEKEHESTAKIMDTAINSVLDVLKDKTDFREAKNKPIEQVTSIDPLKMAMNSLQNGSGIEKEIEEAKKDLEEAKADAKKSEPAVEKVKKAVENKVRTKIQSKKSSNSSFWDNLK